ncbi:hypothetical protein POM88_011686 [Heracleum sosnowskyi]|uniref:Peptidase S59 domain-containing protein n=1 Tax=Heracleum sosnowskyi TaxID=360622 RepID=A0AAD8IVB9_9APIA|nr:hypothetical protein POM88_011686 [Heracleum sosnowskyi]
MSHGSTTVSQVPACIASSSSGSGSGCMTSSGQATVPWFRSNLPGTNPFSFGTQSSFSGNQVKAPIFGPSDKSSSGDKRGSRVTSYTKTTTKDDRGARNFFVSISAMPAYQNKSHEELRWEDHDQFNAGRFVLYEFPICAGAVPVSVQSNDFRNPFARNDSTFPSPITPSVPSNQFSTIVTPPSSGQYSFPNPEPPSVPSNPSATTVTLPSIGQYSILNPAPPSFPSNPYATTVTLPSIGQCPVLNPVPPSVPSNPFFTTPVSIFGGQTTLAQQSPSQNTELKQSPIANPFGTPSAVPQMSTEGTRTPLPVCDKPAPARSPSLLHIRHLSYHKQIWLPIQKYKANNDGPKVAFFDDAQKTPTTPKKEAPLLPRSNPRAFISDLYEEVNLRANFNITSFENASIETYENGEVELLSEPDQDGKVNQDKDGKSIDRTRISSKTDAPEHNCNTDSVCGDLPIKKEISTNVYELMPKLKHSDYFFEPQVEELAIKESYEPGFCGNVRGFVVGRRGYGSIKFLEETQTCGSLILNLTLSSEIAR